MVLQPIGAGAMMQAYPSYTLAEALAGIVQGGRWDNGQWVTFRLWIATDGIWGTGTTYADWKKVYKSFAYHVNESHRDTGSSRALYQSASNTFGTPTIPSTRLTLSPITPGITSNRWMELGTREASVTSCNFKF